MLLSFLEGKCPSFKRQLTKQANNLLCYYILKEEQKVKNKINGNAVSDTPDAE